MKFDKRRKRLSIRKKLFLGMALISIIPVFAATFFTMNHIYSTMREQIIQTRRMSIGWLQDRLELIIKGYTEQFYEFEVNKELKADILSWCNDGQELDYAAKWRLISSMNAAISMDSTINSIELYNLSNNIVLSARRSGAVMEKTQNKLDFWLQRTETLQTNTVFFLEENELLVAHQINRFENKTPLALMVIRMRPYAIEELLADIKTSDDETITLLNDDDQLLVANYGNENRLQLEDILTLSHKLSEGQLWENTDNENFSFYRPVGGGKLQIMQVVPNQVIVSALKQTLWIGVATAVFAIMAAILCSALFSRIISKPIISLSNQMRHVTLKDYDSPSGPKRYDEIGFLNESFDVMMTRNQELIAQEYQSKIEKRNAQLRALQAQINPHFMNNTLQVIGGMALKKNAPEIYSVTLALGDIMRYSLNFSREMVCLREEIRYLQSYLTIQNQRFDNRIKLTMDIDENVMDCLIPKLILQPIFENSFEHGLADKTGSWRICLGGHLTDSGDLLLSVADNGLGISPDRLAYIQEELARGAERALGSGAHIGLNNVNSRIRLKFPGDEYGATISSTQGEGVLVQVLMKVTKEEVQNGTI